MAERRRRGPVGRFRRRFDATAAESTARWAAAALEDQRRTGSRPGRAAATRVAAAAEVASGPTRITLLGQLATMLALEYDATAEPSDLDQAVAAIEAAIEALRTSSVADTLTRCEALTVAGHLHARRFQLRGTVAEIDLAVARYTEATGLLAADDTANHLTLAAAVAGAHLLRYRHDGDPAALDRAAEVAGAAAGRAAGELLTPPAALRLLQARILTARYSHERDPAALAEASVLLDQVCAELPRYDREYAAAHARYAEVLLSRHAERPDPGLLARAIEVARTAVGAGEPRDGYALGLARAVLAAGGAARLDEAAGALRAFLAATGPESTDWPIGVGLVIELLRRAAAHRPDRDDLDEAITWGRRALAVLDAGHPVRPLVATNLTAALEQRHRCHGDVRALHEAYGLAGAAAAVGHGGWAPGAMTAGDRRGIEDLVASVPAGPRRPAVLTAAAVALTRLRDGDRAGLIDLAIRYAGEAVELTPADHPALATRRQALATALRLRHLLLGDRPALDAAFAQLRDTRRTLPPADPRRAPIGVDLARTLALRAASALSPRLLEAAVRLFRDGARAVTAPTGLRIEAAVEWGVFAALAGDWGQAVAGHLTALDLMSWTAPFAPDRSAAPPVGTLAADAVAVLLEHGDRTGEDTRAAAVAAVERGRALLLAERFSDDPEVALLGERHPRRLAELIAVRAGLDADLPAEPDGTTADQRRRLSAQWDAALAGIRDLPGFHRFLRSPDPEELIGAAAGGTVVVVNVSRFRCDALLLGDGDIRVVPLAGLDADTAWLKAEAFAAAVRDATGDPAGRHDAERRISAILAWLDETVTAPVLAALPALPPPRPATARADDRSATARADDQSATRADDQSATAWPNARSATARADGLGRLWWLPTGPLAALPVHGAATEHVSSYLPGLRPPPNSPTGVAAPAGGTPPNSPTGVAAPAGGTVAVVLAPDVGSTVALPAAEEEAAAVAARFPGAVLSGYPADEEALGLIGSSAWLHLACHATAEGLSLGTVTLGVGEIARVRAAGGRLAFLTAAGTAPGDESPAVAAALHAAGYRHVVASLWPSGDEAALRLVRDFYRRLPPGCPAEAAEGAARALHDAVTAARRRQPDRPSTWARLVHFGP